ncbi:hypothetical protein BU24DRAFT_425007 [Aaosphaeria arxii CBS 175.79]|uniref:CENP-V/GFA domain-containing protein n=1 Tax=Aaosphaeria arxii CBS 175.79 TaxID=1450172 RepID=A0A6A5XLH6_9PLEO|nr:uncharacterized protein BU24DRAFT_425007 [Aaosphaeria arxii CBS 175.79]KAF2014002.1 hypothetical protein BU24DRAFT_425007 [Aaosphaeria arxii CBS 175.79]
MAEDFKPLKGHCTCKTITYEVLAPFLCVHCCHCTWCQRETGTAFALNAIIEASNVRITSTTKPLDVDTTSASGGGQMMARCPNCYVVVYSDYSGSGKWRLFVRVGTLDNESKQVVKPDVHIFTSTKLDWVDLTGEKERGIQVCENYYERDQVWRKESLDRFEILKRKMDAAKQGENDN